jgi:lysophospholipase L1-like esterase
MTNQRRILAYGDSLTWGWIPNTPTVPATRYPFQQRWTGALTTALGPDYEIVEEGLTGRTTNADAPLDLRLNGATYLPAALATHLPLDLVAIMLGTCDTFAYPRRGPFDIAVGMSNLLGIVAASTGGVCTAYPAPPVLVLAPPVLGEVTDPWFRELFHGGREKLQKVAPLYAAAARAFGAEFLDAGTIVAIDGVDGIHLTLDSNRVLGQAVAEKVKTILA